MTTARYAPGGLSMALLSVVFLSAAPILIEVGLVVGAEPATWPMLQLLPRSGACSE